MSASALRDMETGSCAFRGGAIRGGGRPRRFCGATAAVCGDLRATGAVRGGADAPYVVSIRKLDTL